MWLINSRDRYFQATQSYALFLLFVPSSSCPCLLSSCCCKQAEQCLTWPQAPHSQKQWINFSRHHNSLLWVNSTEGDSLAHLFLMHRPLMFSLCLVVEHSLWLDAATMQSCWITSKSWLHLDLSTAANASKLISVHIFFFFFFPLKQKQPKQRNGCAGLHFPIEKVDPAKLCCTGWSQVGMSGDIFLLVSMQLSEGINAGQGLGIEIIATFQLVLCVLATTDRRRNDVSGSAPLAIGLSVALGHLLAVSFSSHSWYVQCPTTGWATEGRKMMGRW